jgi:hypothetical protein
VVLTIAGLIQGNAWLNGETIYRVLPEIHMYYVIRVGCHWFADLFRRLLGLYNIVRTLFFNPGRRDSCHENDPVATVDWWQPCCFWPPSSSWWLYMPYTTADDDTIGNLSCARPRKPPAG